MINITQVEQQIESLKSQTMEIIQDSSKSSQMHLYIDNLQAMSEEIKALQHLIAEHRDNVEGQAISRKIEEITELLMAKNKDQNCYDDALVRQLIQTITVKNQNTIHITYQCGYEHDQEIDIQVKKISRAS